MADECAPQPMRTLSRESCARETESAFADFLSDGSNSSDEDDADTRALLRMQQQADDRLYSEAPFKLSTDDRSFRLTLKRPGDFDAEDEGAAGPRKLLDQVPQPKDEAESDCGVRTLDDVMSLVERASRVMDEHLSLVAVEDQISSVVESPRRKTSIRETESAFADFLSDGSNSSEEEEQDDADTRAMLRMQQQADDRMYVDTSFKMERVPVPAVVKEEKSHSFRLTLSRPGGFEAQSPEAWSGPKKLVQEPRGHMSAASDASANSDEDKSFVDDHPSFSDANSFTGASFIVVDAAERTSGVHESLASRPPSFDVEGDSFFDEGRPSFSDEHSFTGGESFTDNSFVYRPSLPDEEDEAQTKANDHAATNNSFVDSSFVYRSPLPCENDEALTHETHTASIIASAAEGSNFVYRPTLPTSDDNSQEGVSNSNDTVSSKTPAPVDSSFVYRPTLPVSDNVSHDSKPTHIDAADTDVSSFAYRLTQPDSDDGGKNSARDEGVSQGTVATQEQGNTRMNVKVDAAHDSGENDHGHEPSFLSPSAASFIRSSDAGAFNFGGTDSSFILHDEGAVAAVDDSFSSVLTDSCASSSPPELDTSVTGAPVKKESTTSNSAAVDISQDASSGSSTAPSPPTLAATSDKDKTLQNVGHALEVVVSPRADASLKPALSRHSSVSSTHSSQGHSTQQHRLTATRESWRVSSLDFRESKHAFDEELGPLAGLLQSPRASAASTEQQRQRLSSTFEERSSVASAPSNASSFASFHSQANFFVDDLQQSFSSASSLSLDSRASGDDSFTNVAILGDDVRDQNERRSSDIISQDVSYPSGTDTLDRSYSDLVDAAVGLDRSFSKLVDREGFYALDGNRSSGGGSSAGTSLGSSLASSAMSQSLAASDELSFVSFSVAKPSPATEPVPQPQQKEVKQHSAGATPARQKLAIESEQVFYKSIVLPLGSDAKTAKPSASPSAYTSGASSFSSALLAAIKTRDARTDTRSEETEAGDVALGALPPLAAPLKINLVTRGRGSISSSFVSAQGGQSSPSISASPLATSSMARSSLASSTGTADHLDFTGVYRGSANSLEASRNNGVPPKATPPQSETTREKPLQERQDDSKRKFDLLAVRLERSISDSRMLQRQSQLKVEEFFRRTYQQDVDDFDEREVHRWTRRTTRARTTVIECVDDIEEEPHNFAFKGNKAAKIIDLKNLRNGEKQPGWHLKDDVSVKPQREEEPARQAAMTTMTFGTTSTGTTATRSMASDLIPMPQNYVISPQAAGSQKPKVQVEKEVAAVKAAANSSGGSGFFSVSSGPGGDDISPFGAIDGRRADNVSLTPTLPRLSAHESPAFSPFMTSLMTPNGLGGSGGVDVGRSPGKSPVGFAGTASGFLWKTGSGFNGLKRSAADAPFGASFSQRPTFAGRVQSFSASLASTLRRFLPGWNAQHNDANNLTSPQSQCTAPAALPRGFDQNGFYQAPFKVPGLNKPLQQHRKKTHVESDRAWVRQWLILATCAVLGLSLGAVLVRVVVFNASVFNLSGEEVRDRQESNGALVLAPSVRWLLLPGHLFLRVWSAVSIPLLVCYVGTSLADLVGCADKSALVLSCRSLGYALLLALLATMEGVLAMWITHKCGWFQMAASAGAATLSDSMGVTPLPEGAAGLLCTGDGEYLQRLGYDVFACSNVSLTLPLYEEVSTNSTGVADSGPAVFALHEVTNLLAAPTASPYYPASFGSGGNMTRSLLSALAPDNIASQSTAVASDQMASLGGLIVFSLLLGYTSGKRILRLRRDAQAAMFESLQSTDRAAEDPRRSRHHIVGVLMELQLALEWIVRRMERYLAPLGFFSLMLGHVVLHHREWRSFTSPMTSLIVGVLILVTLHTAVVLPLVLKQFFRGRRRLALAITARAFVPTFLFAFTTDNAALTAPVTMQCYARVLTVTRSAAQLAASVTAALIRNARALYLPLMVLWLLETSSTEELKLSTSDYFSVGLMSLLSCFCGGSSRLTLAMARTLWSIAVNEQASGAASLLPATMPLLVVCDVFLSRVASVVTLADHLVLTELAAQHWAEIYVPGPSRNSSPSPSPGLSPLDDSQAPRPPSSALLSSVYL
uniref:Transmembrane protein n=1 Tax=Phytophthora ramorum TaxID=164328 RepID=H3GYK6_PHYRM